MPRITEIAETLVEQSLCVRSSSQQAIYLQVYLVHSRDPGITERVNYRSLVHFKLYNLLEFSLGR